MINSHKYVAAILLLSGTCLPTMAQVTPVPFEDGSETPIYPSGYTDLDMYIGVGEAETMAELGNPAFPVYDPNHDFGYVILTFEGFTTNANNDQYDPLQLGRRGWWRDRTDDGLEMSRNGNPISGSVIPLSVHSDFAGTTDGNGIVDAVDMLIALLEEGYDRGFRRFIINRPAGFDYLHTTGNGKSDLPNAGWWSLDAELREDLADTTDSTSNSGGLAWWIAEKNLNTSDPITVGVYIGFQYGDPWSTLHSSDPLNADFLSHVWAMYRNIKPWEDIGVTEFIFDHVGGLTNPSVPDGDPEARSDSLYRLWNHQAFANVHIIGEHPVCTKIFNGGDAEPSGDLDEYRVINNPFVIDAYRLNFNSIDANREWDLSSYPTAELNVFYDYHPTENYGARVYTQEEIIDDIARGFTPWAWGASRLYVDDPDNNPSTPNPITTYDPSVDLIRWIWYDDGKPLDFSDKPWFLADLNGDGEVTLDEGQTVYNNSQSLPITFPRAWEGDLDLDGDIDCDDVQLWISKAALYDDIWLTWSFQNCP